MSGRRVAGVGRARWARDRVGSRRVAALLVGALVAAVPVVTGAGAASAADSGPVLTSVSVSPTAATPAQMIQLHYTATSGTPLASVEVAYDFGGSTVTFTNATSPSTDGTVDVRVPTGSPNGTITLLALRLTDTAKASSSWSRDGSVRYAGGAAGPATHGVAFAPADFTVSGASGARPGPALTSLALSSTTVRPGDTLRLHYDAGASTDLRGLWVDFTNDVKAYGVSFRSQAQVLGATGDVLLVVDDTWANGDYTFGGAGIWTMWGQSSDYSPDGTGYGSPPGTRLPALDPAPLHFTVSGSPADYEPPVLESFGPASVLTTRTGTVSIPYRTTDAADHLASIYVSLQDSQRHQISLAAHDVPLSGVLTQQLALPAGTALADYHPDLVSVTDPGGHQARYWGDGRLELNGARAGTHQLDLSTVTVALAAPPDPAWNVHAVAGDRHATVSWDLDLGGANNSPVTGITVTTSPGGRSVTVRPDATSATITGLANMTTYAFTVRRVNALGPSAPVTRSAMPRAFGQRVMAVGDFDNDRRDDLVGIDRSGTVHLYRGNGRGGFVSSRVVARGWGGERMLVGTAGDQENIRTVNYDGTLVDHQRGPTGTVQYSRPFSAGWGGMSKVFGVGNWDGDAFDHDVMGIKDNGDLYFYRYKWTTAGLYSGVRIGRGWNVYRQVMGVGDVTGDQKSDLLGLRPDGSLWLYAGNGRGGFIGSGHKVATGFAGARAIMACSFDKRWGIDLLTVDSKGYLRLYSGSGRAKFTYSGVVGTGWAGYL